ncbi:MAG: glutamine synthetase [Ignavibacteriae bacterium]|nr:glutamine synthetase [Ignavibacteria bacterium]MBI3365549.1 glutamine synthetase [Ignavibacteriota bacterium]
MAKKATGKTAGVTKRDILELAKHDTVQFVQLQFTDLNGLLKGVTIPISKLQGALEDGLWFDGSSIEGFTRIFESDMYLELDVNTYSVIPWTRNNGAVVARFMCDVYMPDGKPFEGDPRFILKRQLERARKLGYIFNVGPELEFFLFRKENHRLMPLPHDTAGYFDQTTDLAVEIRQEMTAALHGFGIDVEALHHEVAVGQHEIDFRYSDALTIADQASTLKFTLKYVAAHHNLHATFMPKPIAGINGSGMHVHQSFFSPEGKNLFFDAKDEYHLSKLAKSFIMGQLTHIKAMNAILNPTINSYKRLVVGYEAPVYIAWGQRNRSALIRIPRYTPGREKAVRAELRCPDPAANPYLAFAVMLAAGLDGIEKKMVPPPPVEENIYEFSEEEAKKRNIGVLARDITEAVEQLEKDKVIRAALGDYAFEKFKGLKRKEWDEYRMQVTPWEIDQYLEKY